MSRLRLFILLCFAASHTAYADAGSLVVLNKSDHDAAVVNPGDYRILFKLPTGKGPHEVAVSPDGRFAYVSNYGAVAVFRDSGQQQQQFTPGNTITVFDLQKRSVRGTFDLGDYSAPHGIRASRDGSKLWVTVERSQSVLELDASTGEVLKAWNTGQQTSHMVVPTPDEKKLFVANIGSGSVTIINRQTSEVHSVPTAAGAEGIDASPDGREVWVTNRGANTISVIEVASDRVVQTFESGGMMPIRVKFTPDGSQAFVSNARSNSVAVFDVATRAHLGSIEVGAIPVGIVITPSGDRAFVANTNDNKVTVIDVSSRKVLTTFATGTEPDGMAWAR